MKEGFIFKQFQVYHDRCAMKIGTDGVLLGAWADLPKTGRILDIGTGCGLIALMAAQRSQTIVTGVDIDKDAIEQAKENAMRSPWPDRVNFVHASIQDYATFACESFQAILCNPPFFVDSLSCPDKQRNIARHATSLPFPELADSVKKLLHPEGLFSLILPTNVAEGFRMVAWENGLNLQRKCLVHSKQGKPANRVLMTFCKTKCSYPSDENLFICNSAGQNTEDYIRLTKDFYLKY